jgi:hypothetical protein
MPDVLLNTDDLTVLGGPARVDVQLNFGASGQRGSLLLASPGVPTANQTTIGGIPVQLFDVAINVVPGNQYLGVYQYVLVNGEPQWLYLLQLTNNIYSGNLTKTFTAGSTHVSILFSDLVAFGIVPALSEDNFNVQATLLSGNPSALSINNLEIVRDVQNNAVSLDFDIYSAEFASSTWSASTGSKTVHILITVV